MSRRVLLLFTFALVSSGCVPVSEPVGDIDKAEPNKALIGNWKDDETMSRLWVIDRPEVKGNPKGLMRLRLVESGTKLEEVKLADTMWFFTSTVEKHTYANCLVLDSKTDENKAELIDFSKSGVYEKWSKHKERGYYVVHLEINGAVATVDPGNHKAFESLMEMNKFKEGRTIFQTPTGWLAKYLKESGPKDIFTKNKGMWTLSRVKSK